MIDAKGGETTFRLKLVPLLICAVLFVDVPVPLFGSVIRLAAIPTLLLIAFQRNRVSVPRCSSLALLFPLYFALPWLFNGRGDVTQVTFDVTAHLVVVGVAVLAAREITRSESRQQLADYYVAFAAVSAVLAWCQRQSLLGPLGRDLWGRAQTSTGDLRGAAMLSDPNFLAVLLASSVPLIFQWHRSRLRLMALGVVAIGLFSTDSRAGILLALISVAVLLARKAPEGQRRSSKREGGRKLVVTASLMLVILFVMNVGGQRDRVFDGIQVAFSGSIAGSSQTDAAADVSASDRREYATAWFRLGIDSLPWGAGVNAEDFIVTESGRRNAAHNNFIQLLGQGGIAGALIALVTAAAGVVLFRRRSDEFAVSGLMIVLGGLFLSFPGTALVAFPLGVADALARRRPKWSGHSPIRSSRPTTSSKRGLSTRTAHLRAEPETRLVKPQASGTALFKGDRSPYLGSATDNRTNTYLGRRNCGPA
ncbi:O-antigen ligase family protein [Aeromicrobium sp. CFBP 8757]|uniref:O-antigen ligase family protein n=1 Tax=Aeromicrobium sp. CFBP 8757 TaxID=2775288 RepID=UPI00178090E9|nr:O-antigen ligase family protein [Aeromicrobium sp. CFBP 8757]